MNNGKVDIQEAPTKNVDEERDSHESGTATAEHEAYEVEYKKRFEGYTAEPHWFSSKPFDPDNDVVDIKLTTQEGKELYAPFIARNYLNGLFEKNERTGECASGTYFAMRGMVMVKRIDEDSIKKTIEDMIENLEVEDYFR